MKNIFSSNQKINDNKKSNSIFIRIANKLLLIFFPYFFYRTVLIPNQKAKPKKNLIPNTVYQTWKDRKVPAKLAKEIMKFRTLNKDYSFQIFTDKERDKYMTENWSSSPIYKIYLNAVFQPCKSDIFRYCLIYQRGGFYFDIKSGCRKPLSEINNSAGAIISYEASNLNFPPKIEFIKHSKYPFHIIKNWSFAFSPKHPFLKLLIDNIVDYAPFFKGKLFKNPKNAIISFTGPGMMTKVFHDFICSNENKIVPLGIDLDGYGIYELKGAELRFKQSPSYTKHNNSIILL